MSRTGPTTASPSPQEARFGFADFVRVLRERRGLIRTITVLTVALTAAVVSLMPTLYSSSAVVMLDQRKNNVADLSSVLSALPTDPSSVQNQIQVLSSRDLALKVIAKLRLYDDPEFNPALDQSGMPDFNPLHYLRPRGGPAGDGRDAIVTAFLNRLDVNALGLSTSIDVRFTSASPEKAALIANTLARSYTDDQVATKIEAARQAAQWLADRMRQLAVQVQQQEAAVELYKAENNLVESAQGNSLVDQQLVAINAQLVQAQSDLAEKQASYERAQALAKSGNAADVTQVVTSKMIGDLRTQEAELVRQEADLATRYGPNHPRMIAIRNEKRDLEAKIAHEVASVAGSMASELVVARAHVESIKASLRTVEQQARDENMVRIKLNALEANLASTRTMYESFVSRLRAVQDQDDIQLPEARVISTAPVPSAPSSPHRVLFVASSLPAGLLLGILLALILERVQGPPPVRDMRVEPASLAPAEPAPAMAAPSMASALPPVLAELPAIADMRMADRVLDDPAFGRPVFDLLARLIPAPAGLGRVIALTAPTGDLSKAAIVLGLARLAAQHGLRTVLVDGDLGRIVPGGTGLGALLSGAPLARVLVRDRRSNASLFSAPAGGGAWGHPRTIQLMNHLRQTCDVVLIDASPVGTPGAWPALARLCDQVVVVCAARAPQAGLMQALRSLVASAANLTGLVVTR